MLNPWSMPVDSYDINHLVITKANSDDVFTPEEVDLWIDIIKTINIIPAINGGEFTPTS